jgi:hypothetical protein
MKSEIFKGVIRAVMLCSLVRGYQLPEGTCYFQIKREGGRNDGNRLSDVQACKRIRLHCAQHTRHTGHTMPP